MGKAPADRIFRTAFSERSWLPAISLASPITSPQSTTLISSPFKSVPPISKSYLSRPRKALSQYLRTCVGAVLWSLLTSAIEYGSPKGMPNNAMSASKLSKSVTIGKS